MVETSFQVLGLNLHSTTFRRDQWCVCRAVTVQGNREAIMSPTIAHTQPQSLKTVLFVGREISAFSTGSLLQASQEMPWDLLSVPQLGRRYFVWFEGCSVLGCPSSLGSLKLCSAELTRGLLAGALQLFSTADALTAGPLQRFTASSGELL